jgi:hypothetical protein
MAKKYYDRYQQFRINGKYKPLPFIKIDRKKSDKQVTWRSNRDRMDKLSQDYYGHPWGGFIIMAANAQYGGLEDSIPDNETIIIPFPWTDSLQQYINKVEEYLVLYGE